MIDAYCQVGKMTISVAVATLIVHMDNKRWVDNKRRYKALILRGEFDHSRTGLLCSLSMKKSIKCSMGFS